MKQTRMAELLTMLLVGVRVGTLVCALVVLFKMFADETQGGLGKVLLSLLCLAYTIVWGWTHAERLKIKGIMTSMSVFVCVDLVLSIAIAQFADGAA